MNICIKLIDKEGNDELPSPRQNAHDFNRGMNAVD